LPGSMFLWLHIVKGKVIFIDEDSLENADIVVILLWTTYIHGGK